MTTTASIKAGEPKWVTSKYVVYFPEIKANPDDPNAGVLPYYFNINSDVAVKSFTSNDEGNPKGGGLTVNLPARYSLSGTDRFTGTVGTGKIYIKLTNGLVIKGPILEGPTEGSSFVGAGGWVKALGGIRDSGRRKGRSNPGRP